MTAAPPTPMSPRTALPTPIHCPSAPTLMLLSHQVNNNANSQVLPGGNGYLGGVTAFGSKDATSFQFSLRHKF